jgi:hypothetical protein
MTYYKKLLQKNYYKKIITKKLLQKNYYKKLLQKIIIITKKFITKIITKNYYKKIITKMSNRRVLRYRLQLGAYGSRAG